MAIRTEWHTSEGVYHGTKVHVTFPTAGTHTVTRKRVDTATGQVVSEKTITVTTSEEPLKRWEVTEAKLPYGLAPHTGMLVPTQVGGVDAQGQPLTEMMVDPDLGVRGVIPWTCPEDDPASPVQYARVSDLHRDGTADWPTILRDTYAGTAWRPGAKRFIVLDYAPNADGTPKVLPHDGPGYGTGRVTCLTIGPDDLDVDGIIGTGHTVLQVPQDADDTVLFPVWSRSTAIDNEFATRFGRTPQVGTLYATAREMGLLETKGAQHECRVLTVRKHGVVLANFGFVQPKGAPNIIGWHGIRLDSFGDAVLSHLHLQGASWGWNGFPPGETAAIAVYGIQDKRLYYGYSVVDGALTNGTKKGASPFAVSSCTSSAAYPWLIECTTEKGNAHSMNTHWRTDVHETRIGVHTEGTHTYHANFEDAMGHGGKYLSIKDYVGTVEYDGTNKPLHFSINSGPHCADTNVADITIVNPTIPEKSAYHFFSGSATSRQILVIQSQLRYVGTDSVMGNTGPQSLRMDTGTQDGGGMGVRVFMFDRWQQVASNKDEVDPDTGSLITPPAVAPTKKPQWPAGTGVDTSRRALIYR